MLGAFIGDFVGSPYEFDLGVNKEYLAHLDFPLFTKKSKFTDDTVMTIAVCEAVMNGRNDPNLTRREVAKRFLFSQKPRLESNGSATQMAEIVG